MKIKVTLAMNVSVSGEMEVPDSYKVVNGKIPEKLGNRIDDYVCETLFPAFNKKIEKGKEKGGLTKTTIKIIKP